MEPNPADLADRVVARCQRSTHLAAFLADVVTLLPTREACETVLEVLDATADDPDGARAEAARRLRLADLGGLWPRRAPEAGVVTGQAAMVGMSRTSSRRWD